MSRLGTASRGNGVECAEELADRFPESPEGPVRSSASVSSRVCSKRLVKSSELDERPR